MSLPKIYPNYYAVIPGSVRYDNTITAQAKLLYGEIAALCNERGFCWATNGYFGKLYGLNPKYVSGIIASLEAAGHIVIEVSTNGGARNIFLAEAMAKNLKGGSEKPEGGSQKNLNHNNKTNNKDNNTTSSDEAADSHTTTDVLEVYRLYLTRFKVADWQEGTRLTPEQLSKAERRYRLTDGRRAAIRRRLKDAGKRMLMAAIVGYSREPWYTGENDRQWTADLEKFICRSYEKVEEGANKYESQSKAKKTNDPWDM